MNDLHYKIEFYSYWHCGSGLSAGADVDALVIKDKDGLPFIPGKTIKGLLREAAEQYMELQNNGCDELTAMIFGLPVIEEQPSIQGQAFFTDAIIGVKEREVIIKHHLQENLYSTKASTSIDRDGIASSHSLRRIEVAVPCTLYGKILNVNDQVKPYIVKSFGMVKRIGLDRNRGLGRCNISLLKEGGNA